jgi:hypothetical protein
MHRMALVQESRGYDSVLDPVYTSSSNPRPIYRTTVSASTLAGQERFKFQRAPIVPILGSIPPDILLTIEAPPPPAVLRPPTPPTKEMVRRFHVCSPTPLRSHAPQATQSDYRESEAQTDPYTPEYVITDGSNPELLTLANLSYGAGLPATLCVPCSCCSTFVFHLTSASPPSLPSLLALPPVAATKLNSLSALAHDDNLTPAFRISGR